MTIALVISGTVLSAMFLLILFVSREVRGMPRLEEVDATAPIELPSLSVVIPARDEVDTLGPGLTSLLESRYPGLEVILVNDRSTDGTAELMSRFAEEEPRVRVVHVETLPEGWLGKLHALHRGTEAARGELLLFADADIHYSPEALARAATWMQSERLDHVTLIPHMRSASLLAEAVTGHFGAIFLWVFRPSRVNRGVPGAFVGIGAFNMVRRSTFAATPGWEWLRLEVADDVGLGFLLHRHGAKSRIGLGSQDIAVAWYDSVADMVRGLEKNLYIVGAGAQAGRAAVAVAGLLVPWGALVTAAIAGSLELVGVAAACAVSAGMYATQVRSRVLAGALSPFCGPIIALAMARSAWAVQRSGQVRWRDTAYDIGELLQGQRVQLGKELEGPDA